jgi:hypothetical protein
MTMLIHLSQLGEASVELRSYEAVAIAQQLMHDDVDASGARAPFGPLSVETVGIDVRGRVHCHGCAARQSVVEVAIFLQGVLDEFVGRVPVGLRHALARALHEVDAPPFDSGGEFAAVLARFERGNREDVLERLFRRVAESMSDVRVRGPETPLVERRRAGPTTADLRRELREADLHLYEARAAARRMATRRSSGGAMKVAPMIACMMSGVALIAAGEYVAQARRPLGAPAAGRNTIAPIQAASVPRIVPLPVQPAERVLVHDTRPAARSNGAVQRRVSATGRSSTSASDARRAQPASRSRTAKPFSGSSGSATATAGTRLDWNSLVNRAH